MNLRILRTSAAIVFGTSLLASFTVAQTRPAAPESPSRGVTVEEIIARVNDQIITRSDYDRAQKDLDAEGHQRNATVQDISNAHKDLLRNLIDQQLWLSKGKQLDINGETELIKRLDEVRKQFHLDSLEDLEKEAKEQGVSFEDFKANIRNQIITQLVMRQEVGGKVQFTIGEAQRYFEQHKQEYAREESVRLAEILLSTAAATPATPAADASAAATTAPQPDDDAKLAAAQAKATDIEARLHAGGDFTQLAKSFSDGPTAADGGDLGQFLRGKLNKAFEDATFPLKTGQFTEPIRTKQGFVILKVVEHIAGGIPAFSEVKDQVEDNFYASRMEPAMRAYLTQMREEAFIDIKPGYTDSGASVRQTKPVFSAYTPPAPKKKAKVQRTRFRQNTRTYRQKSAQAPGDASTATPANSKKKDAEAAAAMKPGKKEKIRFGQAPSKTLPAADTKTEDAGGAAPSTTATETASATTPDPANPLESVASKPTRKTRLSARPKTPKQPKGAHIDSMAPAAPDAAEVADRQTQAAPLGLAGDTATKTKKKAIPGEKKRLKAKKKSTEPQPGDQPLAVAPQPPPAPQTTTPAPAPEQAPAPQTTPAPQQ